MEKDILWWLPNGNEIPYKETVYVDLGDKYKETLVDIKKSTSADKKPCGCQNSHKDIYMDAPVRTVFGLSVKRVATILVIAFILVLLLKK